MAKDQRSCERWAAQAPLCATTSGAAYLTRHEAEYRPKFLFRHARKTKNAREGAVGLRKTVAFVFGQAKVAELGAAARVQKDVFGLDVAVDQTHRMAVPAEGHGWAR